MKLTSHRSVRSVRLSKVNTRFQGLFFALALLLFSQGAFAEVVGYFKFDSFPNDNAHFTDDAGKGLQGLLGHPFSLPLSVPGPSGIATDLAVSFDGRGALIVDDSAAEVLNILEPPLTLECWVKATNFNLAHIGLVSYGVPGGRPADRGPGGYKLGIGPAGDIVFTLFAVVDVFSGVLYPFDGEWHHVAASYSMTEGFVRFYLDGVEVAAIEETRGINPPGTRQLEIGAQYTGLGRFEGAIDRVRISKAALAPADLDSVIGAVKPTRADTAVYFSFDAANPPYQGEGLAPAGTAVSAAEWIKTHVVHQSDGDPVKSTDTPSGAAGDLSLQFGGADRAVIQDPNGVLNMDQDWTLEAWVKYTFDFEGDRDVIFYYGHPGRGYSLSLNYAAGNMLQVTTLGIADMPSDTAVVEPDAWQHVAVVHKNGESITYFINGVEAGTRDYTGGTRLATTNMVLYVGGEWNGGLPFTGFVDRVRISNTALTAAELDSDAGNPKEVATPLALGAQCSQSNFVITWPEATSDGYALEYRDTLAGGTWIAEPTAPVIANGTKTVTVPISGLTRYFRLRRP